MVKINERFYPFQQWCLGQIQTIKKQPEDKDATCSFPEGQSPQVCMPPCTPAYRVPGSNTGLLLSIVRCWIITSWMALRINNSKLNLFLSEAHFIQKMRSLCTAASKYQTNKTNKQTKKPSKRREETSYNTQHWMVKAGLNTVNVDGGKRETIWKGGLT